MSGRAAGEVMTVCPCASADEALWGLSVSLSGESSFLKGLDLSPAVTQVRDGCHHHKLSVTKESPFRQNTDITLFCYFLHRSIDWKHSENASQ